MGPTVARNIHNYKMSDLEQLKQDLNPGERRFRNFSSIEVR